MDLFILIIGCICLVASILVWLFGGEKYMKWYYQIGEIGDYRKYDKRKFKIVHSSALALVGLCAIWMSFNEETSIPSAAQYELPAALTQNLSAVTMQLQSPYLKYFVALDVRPLLGNVTCPVLALNGTRDMQVDAESNLGALRSGLRGNPFNKIAAVEGVNHMFQHCQTGMTTEYRDIEETFAPEVLEMLVKWLSKLKY